MVGPQDNEDAIYGYVDLFKTEGDPRPTHIYLLSTKRIKIGREHKCDIRIHNVRVSRLQCYIKISDSDGDQKVRLQCLTSKPTTYFKDRLLQQDQHVELQDGDRFKLYDTELRYRAYDPNNPSQLQSATGRPIPIIRLSHKEKSASETPERSGSSHLHLKVPKTDRPKSSRSSSSTGDRLNRSASSAGSSSSASNGNGLDRTPKRRKSSDVDMRKAVLQRRFRKSVQGKTFPEEISESSEGVVEDEEEDDDGGAEDSGTEQDLAKSEDTLISLGNNTLSEEIPDPVNTSYIIPDNENLELMSPVVMDAPVPQEKPEEALDFLDIDREMFALHHGANNKSGKGNEAASEEQEGPTADGEPKFQESAPTVAASVEDELNANTEENRKEQPDTQVIADQVPLVSLAFDSFESRWDDSIGPFASSFHTAASGHETEQDLSFEPMDVDEDPVQDVTTAPQNDNTFYDASNDQSLNNSTDMFGDGNVSVISDEDVENAPEPSKDSCVEDAPATIEVVSQDEQIELDGQDVGAEEVVPTEELVVLDGHDGTIEGVSEDREVEDVGDQVQQSPFEVIDEPTDTQGDAVTVVDSQEESNAFPEFLPDESDDIERQLAALFEADVAEKAKQFYQASDPSYQSESVITKEPEEIVEQVEVGTSLEDQSSKLPDTDEGETPEAKDSSVLNRIPSPMVDLAESSNDVDTEATANVQIEEVTEEICGSDQVGADKDESVQDNVTTEEEEVVEGVCVDASDLESEEECPVQTSTVEITEMETQVIPSDSLLSVSSNDELVDTETSTLTPGSDGSSSPRKVVSDEGSSSTAAASNSPSQTSPSSDSAESHEEEPGTPSRRLQSPPALPQSLSFGSQSPQEVVSTPGPVQTTPVREGSLGPAEPSTPTGTPIWSATAEPSTPTGTPIRSATAEPSTPTGTPIRSTTAEPSTLVGTPKSPVTRSILPPASVSRSPSKPQTPTLSQTPGATPDTSTVPATSPPKSSESHPAKSTELSDTCSPVIAAEDVEDSDEISCTTPASNIENTPAAKSQTVEEVQIDLNETVDEGFMLRNATTTPRRGRPRKQPVNVDNQRATMSTPRTLRTRTTSKSSEVEGMTPRTRSKKVQSTESDIEIIEEIPTTELGCEVDISQEVPAASSENDIEVIATVPSVPASESASGQSDRRRRTNEFGFPTADSDVEADLESLVDQDFTSHSRTPNVIRRNNRSTLRQVTKVGGPEDKENVAVEDDKSDGYESELTTESPQRSMAEKNASVILTRDCSVVLKRIVILYNDDDSTTEEEGVEQVPLENYREEVKEGALNIEPADSKAGGNDDESEVDSDSEPDQRPSLKKNLTAMVPESPVVVANVSTHITTRPSTVTPKAGVPPRTAEPEESSILMASPESPAEKAVSRQSSVSESSSTKTSRPASLSGSPSTKISRPASLSGSPSTKTSRPASLSGSPSTKTSRPASLGGSPPNKATSSASPPMTKVLSTPVTSESAPEEPSEDDEPVASTSKSTPLSRLTPTPKVKDCSILLTRIEDDPELQSQATASASRTQLPRNYRSPRGSDKEVIEFVDLGNASDSNADETPRISHKSRYSRLSKSSYRERMEVSASSEEDETEKADEEELESPPRKKVSGKYSAVADDDQKSSSSSSAETPKSVEKLPRKSGGRTSLRTEEFKAAEEQIQKTPKSVERSSRRSSLRTEEQVEATFKVPAVPERTPRSSRDTDDDLDVADEAEAETLPLSTPKVEQNQQATKSTPRRGRPRKTVHVVDLDEDDKGSKASSSQDDQVTSNSEETSDSTEPTVSPRKRGRAKKTQPPAPRAKRIRTRKATTSTDEEANVEAEEDTEIVRLSVEESEDTEKEGEVTKPTSRRGKRKHGDVDKIESQRGQDEESDHSSVAPSSRGRGRAPKVDEAAIEALSSHSSRRTRRNDIEIVQELQPTRSKREKLAEEPLESERADNLEVVTEAPSRRGGTRSKREDKAAAKRLEEEAARKLEEEEEKDSREREEEAARELEQEAARKHEIEAAWEREEAARKREEKIRKREETARKREEEANRKREEEANRKREEEANRKREEEAANRKREEEATQKREEEAAQRRTEEVAKMREEESTRKQEEKRRKREEATRKREEELARKRAASRLHDEEVARKREEEEAQKEEGVSTGSKRRGRAKAKEPPKVESEPEVEEVQVEVDRPKSRRGRARQNQTDSSQEHAQNTPSSSSTTTGRTRQPKEVQVVTLDNEPPAKTRGKRGRRGAAAATESDSDSKPPQQPPPAEVSPDDEEVLEVEPPPSTSRRRGRQPVVELIRMVDVPSPRVNTRSQSKEPAPLPPAPKFKGRRKNADIREEEPAAPVDEPQSDAESISVQVRGRRTKAAADEQTEDEASSHPARKPNSRKTKAEQSAAAATRVASSESAQSSKSSRTNRRQQPEEIVELNSDDEEESSKTKPAAPKRRGQRKVSEQKSSESEDEEKEEKAEKRSNRSKKVQSKAEVPAKETVPESDEEEQEVVVPKPKRGGRQAAATAVETVSNNAATRGRKRGKAVPTKDDTGSDSDSKPEASQPVVQADSEDQPSEPEEVEKRSVRGRGRKGANVKVTRPASKRAKIQEDEEVKDVEEETESGISTAGGSRKTPKKPVRSKAKPATNRVVLQLGGDEDVIQLSSDEEEPPAQSRAKRPRTAGKEEEKTRAAVRTPRKRGKK